MAIATGQKRPCMRPSRACYAPCRLGPAFMVLASLVTGGCGREAPHAALPRPPLGDYRISLLLTLSMRADATYSVVMGRAVRVGGELVSAPTEVAYGSWDFSDGVVVLRNRYVGAGDFEKLLDFSTAGIHHETIYLGLDPATGDLLLPELGSLDRWKAQTSGVSLGEWIRSHASHSRWVRVSTDPTPPPPRFPGTEPD